MDADAQAAERIVGRFLQELWSRNIPVSTGAEPIRVSASVGIAQAAPTDDMHTGPSARIDGCTRPRVGKNRVLGDGSAPPENVPAV